LTTGLPHDTHAKAPPTPPLPTCAVFALDGLPRWRLWRTPFRTYCRGAAMATCCATLPPHLAPLVAQNRLETCTFTLPLAAALLHYTTTHLSCATYLLLHSCLPFLSSPLYLSATTRLLHLHLPSDYRISTTHGCLLRFALWTFACMDRFGRPLLFSVDLLTSRTALHITACVLQHHIFAHSPPPTTLYAARTRSPPGHHGRGGAGRGVPRTRTRHYGCTHTLKAAFLRITFASCGWQTGVFSA